MICCRHSAPLLAFDRSYWTFEDPLDQSPSRPRDDVGHELTAAHHGLFVPTCDHHGPSPAILRWSDTSAVAVEHRRHLLAALTSTASIPATASRLQPTLPAFPLTEHRVPPTTSCVSRCSPVTSAAHKPSISSTDTSTARTRSWAVTDLTTAHPHSLGSRYVHPHAPGWTTAVSSRLYIHGTKSAVRFYAVRVIGERALEAT